jgi:hypothetical protein
MELTRPELLSACFNPVFFNLHQCRVNPEHFISGSLGELQKMIAAMKIYYRVTPEEWLALIADWKKKPVLSMDGTPTSSHDANPSGDGAAPNPTALPETPTS